MTRAREPIGVESRRQLAAELGRLRQLIDAYAGREPEPAGKPARPAGVTPLDHLCAVFELNTFERAVLVLCAGVELDRGFAESCAAAQGGKEVARPTIGLAMAALPEAEWSDLAPFAVLRESALITVTPTEEVVRGYISIDEALLHYLLDGVLLDPELLKISSALPAPETAGEHEAAFARRVCERWLAGQGGAVPLRLEGAAAGSRFDHVALIAGAADGVAYRVAAALLPTQPGALWDLARRWRRFWRLHGAIPVLDLEDATLEAQRAAERLAEILEAPSILTGRTSHPVELREVLLVREPPVTPEGRVQLWRSTLGEALGRAPDEAALVEFADRFRLPPAVLRSAARAAAGEPDWRPTLLAACRAYGRSQLEGLAECIEPRGGWDRLVLPEEVERPLREMVDQIRHRDVVRRRWKLGGGSDRGLSTTALFAGPSGAGKTLAAEVIAAELGLDLYRIDLASVVSKYIGETEKHLARLFDAAESSGAVLLFDEADTLFGKRGEVHDSTDRYANMEVGYLLQRVERYSGVAILTTNLRDSIDQAFLRRLRFVVDFTFPDEPARARLWDLWLPAGAPRGRLDAARLGRVALSGGQIFNVAVNASYLAAAGGGHLEAQHLLAAIRREYGKTGRAISDSEARAVTAAEGREL